MLEVFHVSDVNLLARREQKVDTLLSLILRVKMPQIFENVSNGQQYYYYCFFFI